MGASLIPLAARLGVGALAKKFGKKIARKAIGMALGKTGTVVAVGAATLPIFKGGGGGGRINFPSIDIGRKGPGVFHTTTGGVRGRIEAGENGACPSGYHLNKHSLTDGTPKRSVCVRNRSMNYANGRAAKRAGRRVRGTVKMLKRSFSLVSGHPPKGKFIPKK